MSPASSFYLFACLVLFAALHSLCLVMFGQYIATAAVIAAILGYLWLANHAMTRPLPEAMKYAQAPWTNDQMREAYEEAQSSTIDIRPFLPPHKRRRYVVVGGSGMCTPKHPVSIWSLVSTHGTPYAKRISNLYLVLTTVRMQVSLVGGSSNSSFCAEKLLRLSASLTFVRLRNPTS